MRFDVEFQKRIKAALEGVIHDETDRQVEIAKAAIESRVREQTDAITLKILAAYDVSMDQNQLVIRVLKGDLK